MKNLKYLCLLITLIFSVNSLSNPTVAMSTICDLNRANVESCQNLYDSFLVDLMNQVAAAEKGFDKKKYVEDKLAYYKAELRVLEMFIPKTQKRIGPIVQATQPFAFGAPFDFFTSFQSVLSQLFAGFWSDPDEEQAEVGGNSDYEADINDHKLRIAMYEEVLLTLPAFKTGSYINKYDNYWSITSAFNGATNPKELDAFTLMLQYLKVKSLDVTLAEGFETIPYLDSITDFKRNIFYNRALTDLTIAIRSATASKGTAAGKELSEKFFGEDFAGPLAKKIISSRKDSETSTFESLSISGVVDIDEFLENFYSVGDFLTNYSLFDFLRMYPQLDSLTLNTDGKPLAFKKIGFLSKESLVTIDALLVKGLKTLSLDYKIHQESKFERPSPMLINAFDELTQLRMDKALALKELTLASVTEGDAALFVKYLMGAKSNLESLTFINLPELGSATLLDALIKIYSNKGDDSHMKSEIELTSLFWNGPMYFYNLDNAEPRDEAHMSSFLTVLAANKEAAKLDSLTLTGKSLTDKNIEALAHGITVHKYLCPSQLDLSMNKISVDGAATLLEAIKVGCGDKVDTLNIYGNFAKESGRQISSKYSTYVNIVL